MTTSKDTGEVEKARRLLSVLTKDQLKELGRYLNLPQYQIAAIIAEVKP